MRRNILVFVSFLMMIGLVFFVSCAPLPPPSPAPEIEPTSPPPVVPEKQPPPEKSLLPTFPLTVTDDLGRAVRIENLPQRIVSLAPSNTEILFALGLGDKVVGVTDYCDYPEEARRKPKVSGFYPPDLERVVAAKPDLVLAAEIHENTAVPPLQNLGLTVVVLAPKTLDEVLKNISLVGEINGKSKEATQLVANLNQRIEVVTTKTKTLAPKQRPRVLYICWHDPIWAAGSETFMDDMVQKAGGINIFTKDFSEWRIVSIEAVIDRNPQVIIVSGMGITRGTVFNSVKNEPRLKATEAIIKGRIYEIEGELSERPGPRLIEGLEELAKLIHPELFEE